jgi:tetratricopeptide (TPR) repeat protein
MKRTIYLFLAILLICSGCQQNSLKQQLVEIDSTALQKGDKLALEMLDNIVPETINDEECLAYYWLLKIRTEIRLQKDINSAESLEIPIAYYKKHHDKGKLARAYGYKAYILDDLGDLKNAIIASKEAEKLVKGNRKELDLANHIYLTLSVVNLEVHEDEIALKYSKHALQTAYQLNRPNNIIYALMAMYNSYHALNNIDSAQYYLQKCIPLIKHVPEGQRHGFYANIGNALVDTDIKQAEEYLNISIEDKPNVFAFRSLAKIYYKRGELDKAKDMWAKALQTDNLYLKSEVMQAMYESQQEEGDYKSASETAMKIVALKDSIAQKEKDNDLRGLQEEFEKKRAEQEEQLLFKIIIGIAVFLLLLATTISAYLFYRNRKGRAELNKMKRDLAQYRDQLKGLEKGGKGDPKEVERLTKKISDLQRKQNALLENGRERYEEVMGGGTTLRWNRNDFMDCIEYYRTQDADFVVHMEQDYRHLSSKYIFFALMEHLGKKDEELQHIMVISQNTVRSIRSRINKKQK